MNFPVGHKPRGMIYSGIIDIKPCIVLPKKALQDSVWIYRSMFRPVQTIASEGSRQKCIQGLAQGEFSPFHEILRKVLKIQARGSTPPPPPEYAHGFRCSRPAQLFILFSDNLLIYVCQSKKFKLNCKIILKTWASKNSMIMLCWGKTHIF